MKTKEQQAAEKETRLMIERVTRPLQGRLDKAEKEIRRLKSEINNLKNAVNRIK